MKKTFSERSISINMLCLSCHVNRKLQKLLLTTIVLQTDRTNSDFSYKRSFYNAILNGILLAPSVRSTLAVYLQHLLPSTTSFHSTATIQLVSWESSWLDLPIPLAIPWLYVPVALLVLVIFANLPQPVSCFDPFQFASL